MRIAFNPSTVAALTAPPDNKDITFDLRGRNIFARGVKFQGTDTNTWRDIKINNVSIDSNILDLRDGDNTTLTNINGVVTINSTWRPVVDNLTSDSTTSSLSANQGRILAELINGKSDSGHNHDDRYLKLTGGTMAGTALITFADSGSWGAHTGPQGARGGLYWTGQSDYAKLYAEETARDNLDLVIKFGDDDDFNGLSIRNKDNTQTSYISAGGVITTRTFKGNLDWSYITNKPATATRWPSWDEIANKPNTFTPSSHSHNYAANENYGGFTKSGRLPISGFYQSDESESGGNAPWSSWVHLINCQHSNTNNNYALQIAASFFDNNTFKIRVTDNDVNNDWRDIIHSGNIGSQTVASATKLQTARNIWGQPFDGTADVSGNMSGVGQITFSALSGTNGRALLYQQMADNDFFRIYIGATASNSGYAEIATADDGHEPIYVRQYSGVFNSVVRTLTLLDAKGYTHFPSYINIGGNENNNSSPDRVWGSNSSDSYLRSYRTSALSVANADTVDGYHENSFLRYRGVTYTDQEATLWSQIGIKQYNNALPDNLTGVYNYGSVISLPGSSSRFEIYASHQSSSGNGLYYRSGWGSDKKTWLKFIDSSNIGSQSVNYANSAGYANSARNAETLGGMPKNYGQAPFNTIPCVGSDGVMEIGRYIDYHYDNSGNYDFSTRLQASGNNRNVVTLPLESGTLALTSYGGDSSHPIFLGYLDLDHGNDGTISSSFCCLGYSVSFTYTRGGNYCKIYIPDTSYQVFYIKAAIASVNYSGGGMDTWTGYRRGEGAWWLHCYAAGPNEVRVKGFRLANDTNDSWWGGNPLQSSKGGANIITVCIFGYVIFR